MGGALFFAQIPFSPAILNYGGEGLSGNLSGENALLLATAASARFAQGRSAEELEFWAAFFNVVGVSLALLALGAPSADE